MGNSQSSLQRLDSAVVRHFDASNHLGDQFSLLSIAVVDDEGVDVPGERVLSSTWLTSMARYPRKR